MPYDAGERDRLKIYKGDLATDDAEPWLQFAS